MRKLGVFLLCFIFTLALASSQVNQTNQSIALQLTSDSGKIDKAYQCIEDLIDSKTETTLSFQEAIFGTLALGSDSTLSKVIENEKSSDSCWPKSSCTIKDTALVLLAYDRSGKNTKDIENWLSSKNSSAKEINWLLQIDITQHIPASCSIKYQGNQKTINIQDDMTLSGNPGTCFTIDSSGYWLKVKDSCVDETFQISCNQDFVTNLLYQKTGSQTIFISPNTHSSASSGFTEEKITARCLKTGNNCDYEGTLWAALALDKTGNDVSSLIPYLIALEDENLKYLPSAFIYHLTGADSFYSTLVQSQVQGKYWSAPSSQNNKFYDTAVALLGLQSSSSLEADIAKDYLLQVQTPEGCWDNNNLRNTAFLLYSGWAKQVSSSSGSSTIESCESASASFSCTSVLSCTDAGGSLLSNYYCPGVTDRCCSLLVEKKSCSELTGNLCASNEQCEGTTSSSKEGSCCLGSCIPLPSASVCEQRGNICAQSCGSSESQTSDLCTNAGEVCCSYQEQSSGYGWIWVIILLILVALIILAIIYRNKLQLWWFSFRNRNRKGGASPQSGPRGLPPSVPPRMISRQPIRLPVRSSTQDHEFEETLRKLKEIGK